MIIEKGTMVKIICTNIDARPGAKFVGKIGHVIAIDLRYAWPYKVRLDCGSTAWSRVSPAFEEIILPKELFEI